MKDRDDPDHDFEPSIPSDATTVFIQSKLFAIIVGCLLAFVAWLGYKAYQSTWKITPVVPPTRQNLTTASFPAGDVLVRASVEPTEEAGKTLLRGAVKDGETPAEEF